MLEMIGNLWKFDRHLAMILRCGDKERVLWARRRPWASYIQHSGIMTSLLTGTLWTSLTTTPCPRAGGTLIRSCSLQLP